MCGDCGGLARWQFSMARSPQMLVPIASETFDCSRCFQCPVGHRSADLSGWETNHLCPPVQRHHDRSAPFQPVDCHADGTDHRPLTTGNFNDASPRWSHDGSQIIYIPIATADHRFIAVGWIPARLRN